VTCENGNCDIATKPKPIHGAPIPEWQELGLLEHSPFPGDGLAVGDLVTYHNECGLGFPMEIIGFSLPTPDFRPTSYIHVKTAGRHRSGSAWWFAHSLDEIRKN